MERRAFPWLLLNAVLWMVLGSAATLLVERMRDRRPSLGDLADEAIGRMGALDLTAEQMRSLQHIRDEWRGQILAEERGWLDRLDQAAADADAKVAALLTPEQAQRYRALALAPRSQESSVSK
jgi:hypothetical protein